jgi:predicted PurR-regulated permease PerM
MSEPIDGRALRQWFTVGVIVLILAAVVLILAPVRKSIAWAAFLAFLLLPLQRRLTPRFGHRPGVAAGVLTGLAPIVLLVPLTLIAMAFAEQVATLVGPLQANVPRWNIDGLMDPHLHPRIAQLARWVEHRFNVTPLDIHRYLVSTLQRYASTLAASSGQIVLNAAGGFVRFFLTLFILFFLLRDGAAAFARVTLLLPLEPARREQLLDRLARVTRAVVFGAGLTALGQGTLVGIAFALTGLPGPVVFGVLASLLALLPVGGAALVWLPGAGWLLYSGHFGLAVFMLVWGLLLTVADNIVRPAIISRQTPVPTLLVFLGVLGGVAAFGFIGFIFGPVILVLATELLRFAEGSLNRRA